MKSRLTVPGSRGLISTVSCLSCGAVLFIPVSHVCASPARVLQSNLPPLSLPPTPSGNTYFLPPAPPRPPAVRWRGENRRGGEERQELKKKKKVMRLRLWQLFGAIICKSNQQEWRESGFRSGLISVDEQRENIRKAQQMRILVFWFSCIEYNFI